MQRSGYPAPSRQQCVCPGRDAGLPLFPLCHRCDDGQMFFHGRALRSLRHAVLALACTLAGVASAAPVDIDAFDGASGISLIEDPTATATLADIRKRPPADWRAATSANVNLGYSASAFWFRFELRNPSLSDAKRLLEIAAPVLDHVDVHVEDAQGRTTAIRMGSALPFAQRPLAHRHFVVPLQWSPQETLRLHVRVQTASSVQFPVSLRTQPAFHAEVQAEVLLHGLYFGVMLAMLVYNLFLYLSVREASYLWYVLWVAGAAGFVGATGGFGFQYLWPDRPHWNGPIRVGLLAGSVGFACLFAYQFLDLRRQSPRLGATVLAIGLPSLAIAIASPIAPYGVLIRLAIATALAGAAIGFVIGISRLRDGFAPAKYYLIAWSVVLVGAATLALNKIGVLPHNVITENASQVGGALQVVLLSFGLAARLADERRWREQAQAQAIRTQREANESLEQRVNERTRALEEANARLRDMSQTDGLTGLRNRRHFDEQVLLEAHRAARTRVDFALLLIDIDHFKRINDTHGHLAGDECLRQVAATLKEQVRRATDTVARYGGEEFCAILPAISADGASQLAEQVRLQIERTVVAWGDAQIRLTVSVGVCCGSPSTPQEAQAMLQQADAALYESKRLGRNRVTLAGLPPGPGSAMEGLVPVAADPATPGASSASRRG